MEYLGCKKEDTVGFEVEISNINIIKKNGRLDNKTVLCESVHERNGEPFYKIVVDGQGTGYTYIEIVSEPLCDQSSATLFFKIIKIFCETPPTDSSERLVTNQKSFSKFIERFNKILDNNKMANYKVKIVDDIDASVLSVSKTSYSSKTLPTSVHVNFAYPFDKINNLYKLDLFKYIVNLREAFDKTNVVLESKFKRDAHKNILNLVAWYAYEKLELKLKKANQIDANKQFCHLVMKAKRDDIIKYILTDQEKELLDCDNPVNLTPFLKEVYQLYAKIFNLNGDLSPYLSTLYLNSTDRDEIRSDGKLPVCDGNRVVIEIRDKHSLSMAAQLKDALGAYVESGDQTKINEFYKNIQSVFKT